MYRETTEMTVLFESLLPSPLYTPKSVQTTQGEESFLYFYKCLLEMCKW